MGVFDLNTSKNDYSSTNIVHKRQLATFDFADIKTNSISNVNIDMNGIGCF